MGKKVEIHFDLETTARGPSNSPEAHFKNNKVVMAGWSVDGNTVMVGTVDALNHRIMEVYNDGDTPLLIAHNLKFDLKYLLRFGPKIPWEKFEYHCTMTGRYRTSGHEDRFISLEALCAIYKIPFKKGLDLGALIKAGIDVDHIDKIDLEEYLIDDVEALMTVDKKQNTKHGSHNLDLDYILPLARMELNGLPLDRAKTQTLSKELALTKALREDIVENIIINRMEYGDGSPITKGDFKALAPRTLSYFLTGYPEHGCGGSAKDKPAKQIKFKKGKSPALEEYTTAKIFAGVKPNPNLGYPMNASVMDELVKLSATAADYKKAKDANKILNTYCLPFLVQAAGTGGTIHPKLNTCATATGRLSSSNPNGQNIPPQIRNLIKSTEGNIYEIDFAQLEMVGAATLSGDPVMLADITGGRDIHYETGKSVMGWKSPSDMTKTTRRTVKGVNFGLLYGGGAKGIAENTGADEATVKKLIKAFYERYPRVKDWQDEVLFVVKLNAWVAGTKDGESYKASTFMLPHAHGGRKFYFEESLSPHWLKVRDGRSHSFKPTETKNYPIQGFAGGDIVMKALTILDDVLSGTSAVLRMTVHDSIVVDWKEGKKEDLEKIMTSVCKIVESNLGIPVQLSFDVEHDTYWL